MATSSTLNDWLNELSASILKSSVKPQSRIEKLQDNFRRQVRKHTNARTNQFEVAEHLDGLEEKFQVLSLDNLADALHVRRNELKDFQNHWIPDVLDLFLRLSGDPARSEKLHELYKRPIRIGTPPPLRWKDIIADSPINKKDQLWRVPNFRDDDDSGYEDEISSQEASPRSIRDETVQSSDRAVPRDRCLYQPDFDAAIVKRYQRRDVGDTVSEEGFIREAVFSLKGLPTPLFQTQNERNQLKTPMKVNGLSNVIIQAILSRLNELRKAVSSVRKWTSIEQKCIYVAVTQDIVQNLLRSFDQQLDSMSDSLLNPTPSTSASIIALMADLDTEAFPIVTLAHFLQEATPKDDIEFLQRLYEDVQIKQFCHHQASFALLSSMLWQSLEAYLKPIVKWISQGQLEHELHGFFITRSEAKLDLARLWHKSFQMKYTGEYRPPEFLFSTADLVLACGKTSAFLQALGLNHEDLRTNEVEMLNNLLQSLKSQNMLPVQAAFERGWHDILTDLLKSRTGLLKKVLTTQCGLPFCLDSLAMIYLGLDPGIFFEIERKIFDRIDQCHDNWNDRFELIAMLEDVLMSRRKQTVFTSLSIHSAYTSSRTMQSRRSSVKILNALSFRCSLLWPLANIIEERALVVYSRISLLLMQVRRAKHVLETTGYKSAMYTPLGEGCGPAEQKYAQILSFELLTFVNTLLDHLMMSTIEPNTTSMRSAILKATSVDEMIQVHKDYMFHLEHSTLVASKLRVLHQSLIILLDLCIRFSDLVSRSTTSPDDGEAHSFTSARSKTRTAQFESDSDSDDDQLVEGYSSFIVLDDDTSIFKELAKVKYQFEKSLKSFVVGLKGVSSAGQHVSELGLLGDRLTWNSPKILIS